MNRFFFIGDLHGDTAPIGHLDKEVNLTESDWVILLGDSGINYWANTMIISVATAENK